VSTLPHNKKLILLFAFMLFLALRVPGLDLPYYQDERVWNTPRSFDLGELRGIPHPPLTGVAIVLGVNLLGPDNLRYMPFIFSIINFGLLFYFVRYRFSRSAALWSVLLFSAGFYSVLASLMVDTDGQILPFFFLISAICYYRWRDSVGAKEKVKWGAFLVLAVLGGFLVKFSFAIVIGALIADFIYSKKDSLTRKLVIRYVTVGGISGVVILGIIWGMQYLLPSFDLSRSFAHWKPFLKLSNRNYLQTCVQFLKSLLYLSPLLLVSPLLLTKVMVRKLSLFIIFIISGLIFYLVIFDFSSGALDRYLQFMIIPLSIISGVVLADMFKEPGKDLKNPYIWIQGFLIAFIIFLVQFYDHFVPALYPKEEWFSRVLSLKWNFLFPFTGGSGPMGFYVSWLFIGLSWITAVIFAGLSFFKSEWRKSLWIAILILGFTYNAVFIEEYLFGSINGSSTALLKNAVKFIENNKNITAIISYNNIGNYELSNLGKYERRLYIAPKFEKDYIDIINNFKGHYFVIDVPRIHSSSPYAGYFSSCQVIYKEYSGEISSKIYDCQNVKFR
jgi:hypothetical protein